MGSVLAIVSKAVFEKLAKQHGGADIGTVLPLDLYASKHSALASLADGGTLFLVTVRPPDERLWLVACLEAPTLGADGWTAAPNTTPVTEITSIKGDIEMASGSRIQAKPGALGMSLQTPRALAPAGVDTLRAALGAVAPAPRKSAAAAKQARQQPAVTTKAKPAKAPRTADLDALASAIDDQSPHDALAIALELWRASRATALAELIDTLSGKIEAPTIDNERAFTAAAATREPAVVGALLAAIPELPVSFLPQAAAQLAELALDPRIAMAVATWTNDPLTTSSSTYPFWTRLLDYTARAADPRTVAPLEKALDINDRGQFWPRFHKSILRVLAAMREIDPQPVDVKQIGKLAKAAAKLDSVEVMVGGSSRVDRAKPAAALELAATAFANNQIVAAIDQLLVAWRATRVAALADLIDRATRLLPSYNAPLGATEKEIQAAWMDAFSSDPVGRMPQLLRVLNVGGPAMAEQRLTKLSTLSDDDPRISLKLAEATTFHVDRISPERTQYWKALFELIARMRDVRVCAPLRAQFRDFAGNYYNHHRQGRRIVGSLVLTPEQVFGGALPMLDPAANEQLAAVEKALAGAEARRDRAELELLKAIRDDWNSDGPRLVYADWLSEREHPRGEYIVLACKSTRTAAEQKRLEQLAKAPGIWGNEREFGAADRDRGVTTEIELSYQCSTLTWRALAGDPGVALVESIRFYATNWFLPEASDVARFLLHADLLRLRAVENLPKQLLDTVAPLVRPKYKVKGTNLLRTDD